MNENQSTRESFCNHHEVYQKAKDAVINGQLPCDEKSGVVLAAIYYRLEWASKTQDLNEEKTL